VVTVAREALQSGGRLIVVEYDADRGNPWVPYPFSFETWQERSARAGLVGTRLIGRVPSRFLGAIYAAVSEAPTRTQTATSGAPPTAPDEAT